MIEESISMYKQEIFWENLAISMSSLSNLLNEEKSHLPIVFEIQSEELEQILDTSEKIDAIDLDPTLTEFFKQCFTIKEKIRSYFEFSFGRHFIFTSSDSFDYCLLLVNDDLINKFGCSSSSSIKHKVSNEKSESSHASYSTSSEEKKLYSFVLLKFDKKEKTTQLLQVERVHHSCYQNQKTPISKGIGENLSNDMSFLKDKSLMAATLEKVMGSNKYLSFIVNNLIYVVWESMFLQS